MTNDRTDAQDQPAASHGVYGISVAAELSGIPVQSLRLYESHGLLPPIRSDGGTRRYSPDDLARLRRISRLVDAGVNLAGVARVLECFAASAAVQNQPERALHFAGAAAALRENIGTPLAPAEQVKLETLLQPARQSLSGGDVAAWLEGWSTPVEKAVDDALASHA